MSAGASQFIPKDMALERLFAHWTPQPETEEIPLGDCVGRVLAEDQYAGYNLPLVRASRMDGIAVKSIAFTEGIPDTSAWRLGVDYVRADTGDDFDDAFDAVIAIENVTLLEEGGVQLTPGLQVVPGLNVKPGGKDVKKDSLLVRGGTLLTALDLAALALGGFDRVPVVRKPRVGFLPTGSELIPVGTPLRRGQNYDTNSLLVEALLRQLGAEPVLHPIVRDDPAALAEAVETLLDQCDILLVNAGTSKGGEDYCAGLLEEKGEVLFHGVAAVPGRPMSMAILGGKPVINLSGPTFAAFYGMDWAVKPLICRWLGLPLPQRKVVTAVLTAPLGLPPKFSCMSSVHLERGAEGIWYATPLSFRGPNSVGTAAALTAEGVYVSQPGEESYQPGQTIQVELLRPVEQISLSNS